MGNGFWVHGGIAPGLYRLEAVQEDAARVTVPASYLLLFFSGSRLSIPDTGTAWRATGLAFEVVYRDRAIARFGMPLCDPPGTSVPPSPAAPSGPPSASTTGCAAFHFGESVINPYTLTGTLSGLRQGDRATITVSRVGQLQRPPPRPGDPSVLSIPPEKVATFSVSGGTWAFSEDVLNVRFRYLIEAHAEGYEVSPPSYTVDLPFAYRFSVAVGGFDFSFSETPRVPTPTPSPTLSPTPTPTPWPTPMAAPGGLNAPGNFRASQEGETDVRLGWSSEGPGIGYELWRWDDKSGWVLAATLAPSVSTYLDQGLRTEATYWYALAATRGTTYSESVFASVYVPFVEVPMPKFQGVEPLSDGILLRWRGFAHDATGYELWRWDEKGGWVLLGRLSAETASFSDTRTLQSGVIYTYFLAAFKDEKHSEWAKRCVMYPNPGCP